MAEHLAGGTLGLGRGCGYSLSPVYLASYKSRAHKLARAFDKTIVNIYPSDGNGLKKDSFVKCDKLVYFNNPPHKVKGSIDQQAWRDILRCVKDLDNEDILEININNL